MNDDIMAVTVYRYLFIKALHGRHEVLQARTAVLEHIQNSGADKFDPQRDLNEGILHQRCGLGCGYLSAQPGTQSSGPQGVLY